MATVTFNDSSASFLSNDTTEYANISSLPYLINTNEKWIYCNYPENLRDPNILPTKPFSGGSWKGSLADSDRGNSYLNQVTVGAGTHQIFYSYQNIDSDLGFRTIGACTFAIYIWNAGSTSIRVVSNNNSHGDNGSNPADWSYPNAATWANYFRGGPVIDKTIAGGTGVWFFEKPVPSSCIFSGNMHLTVTGGSAQISVMVYKDKNKIDGTAKPFSYPDPNPMPSFPYANDFCSGTGNGFYYRAENPTIQVANLSTTAGIQIKATYPSGIANLTINGVSQGSDLIQITRAANGSIVPLNLLGNWCAMYNYSIRFVNGSSARVVKGFVRTDVIPQSGGSNEGWIIINHAGQTKYAHYRMIGSTAANNWQWLTLSLGANESYTLNFTSILGTNSSAKMRHVFKL